MLILSVLLGVVVGLSLGLTGGGGSILAMPLLVYGLGLGPHDAVGLSLATVGATALFGVGLRWRRGELDWLAGGIFAAAGMAGAPVGMRIGNLLPETVLLLGLAVLMGVVAVRLWWKAGACAVPAFAAESCEVEGAEAPACRFDAEGRLRVSSRCGRLLMVLGLLTGVLSGLFGVGGGFVIVPALVVFVSMPISRAVATSLLVIVMISAVGVGSHLLAGRSLDPALTGIFIGGGVVGVAGGTAAVRRLPAAWVQRVFAGIIVVLAGFIVIERLFFAGVGGAA